MTSPEAEAGGGQAVLRVMAHDEERRSTSVIKCVGAGELTVGWVEGYLIIY